MDKEKLIYGCKVFIGVIAVFILLGIISYMGYMGIIEFVGKLSGFFVVFGGGYWLLTRNHKKK